jgi:hypothetical protein
VVHNFLPGKMEELGFAYEVLGSKAWSRQAFRAMAQRDRMRSEQAMMQ